MRSPYLEMFVRYFYAYKEAFDEKSILPLWNSHILTIKTIVRIFLSLFLKKIANTCCSSSKYKKICIIASIDSHNRSWGLGDDIFRLPAVSAIYKYYQGHLSVITNEVRLAIFENNPQIDRIVFRRDRESLSGFYIRMRKLRRENFDLVICFVNDTQSLLLKCIISSLQTPFISIPKFWIPQQRQNTHQIAHSVNFLSKFWQTQQTAELTQIFIAPKIKKNAQKQLRSLQGKKIGIVIGSSSELKHFWRWQEVIDEIDLQSNGKNSFVLLGDQKAVEESQRLKVRNHNMINFVGKTKDFTALCSLISNTDICLGVDSGPIHAAIALNKKAVVIFSIAHPQNFIQDSDREIETIIKPCPAVMRCYYANGGIKCLVTKQRKNIQGIPPCMANVSPRNVAKIALDLIAK